MGLLEILERYLLQKKQGKEQVDLKEIYCKKTGDDYIQKFRTAVVGSEYKNLDGSSRRDALKKVREGEKVRLILHDDESKAKKIVYVVRKGKTQELAMPDCFGRLNDKVTTDVVRWLTNENIVTSATVAKIMGGTPKRPKLTCVLDMRTYPGPKEKK